MTTADEMLRQYLANGDMAAHNGQQYRVIYNANGDMWARDVLLNPSPKKTTRQPMESFLAKKLIVKSSVGTLHIWTHAGLMCGRKNDTEPYTEPVDGRQLCGRCARALCAVWDKQAVPAVEPPPF